MAPVIEMKKLVTESGVALVVVSTKNTSPDGKVNTQAQVFTAEQIDTQIANLDAQKLKWVEMKGIIQG